MIALLLFGVSFGYVEAAVVSNLRSLFQPVRQRYYPDRSPDDLFPLLSLNQAGPAGQVYLRLLHTEYVREAATLSMLAGVALAVGRNSSESFAVFLITFGVWDISFYAFLRLLIHWPASKIAFAQYKRAIRGAIRHAIEIADRVEGKLTQRLAGADDGEIVIHVRRVE